VPFIEKNGVRLLFIHVPKTGGTSVENWLASLAPLQFFCHGLPDFSRCTPQHYRMRDFRTIFQPGYFDYAFMIVRDPYARIESEYRMQNALAGGGFFKAGPHFSLWLEQGLRNQKINPHHLDNHLRPQWEFGGDEVEVFKFEAGLERALVRAAELLGVAAPEELPRELSTGGHDRVHWDRVDRILVEEHYHRDFEEFSYPLAPMLPERPPENSA